MRGTPGAPQEALALDVTLALGAARTRPALLLDTAPLPPALVELPGVCQLSPGAQPVVCQGDPGECGAGETLPLEYEECPFARRRRRLAGTPSMHRRPARGDGVSVLGQWGHLSTAADALALVSVYKPQESEGGLAG